MNNYDAVVIGLGAVGSFALRSLTKTPGRWLGIERYSLGSHAHGSSHGKTRIFRRAYFEHPHYVPWIEYSIGVFRELQELHNDYNLMQECGMLLMAPKKTSSRSHTNLPPLLSASVHAATEHNIPIKFLDSGELQLRYPQFCYEHDMVGILEPSAGILRPERIIQVAQADAEQSGYGTLLEHTAVTNIETRPDGKLAIRIARSVEERNDVEEDEIVADSVLISAGAWTSQLIRQWAPYLTVTRQLQAWIDTYQYGDDYSLKNMPAWFMETPGWQVPVYGVPADPTAGAMKHWIKVGTHCHPEYVLDPSIHSAVVTKKEYTQLQQTTSLGLDRKAWAGHDAPQFVATQPCMYTMTPDSHFLISSPSPGIFGVSACSGHGFKMAPALGQMMSDFALGKSMAQWRLDFCSPERF